MKKLKNIIRLIAAVPILFMGCQDNNFTFGDIVTPSNIQITATIVGADAANPNGDGSGTVHFSATADNAVSFKYVYNGIEQVAPSGRITYNFSVLGLNTHTVTVVASGTAGVTSSASIQVQVLATYEPPADLKTKLYDFDPANPTAASSRTWRIKSEKAGHFGLGPVGGTTPSEWYGAGPNEKVGVGMYDDRFVFNSDGTYMHITNNTNDASGTDTSGTIFGRNPHIVNDLGSNTGVINGADIENYVYSDYSETWSLTAPGGVETLSLTGLGFIGYYTGGNHTYQIFDRSVANELLLRTTDAAGEFDWWFIITSD
ncbi:MAG: glucan endo-1,3-beta-D-glucosidase [Flavobacteriaceae bacterium]|nr:MAG: glucan endo-1,3-beta-D-glucosidase [Flavobacteriaceae bacterium]